MPWGLSIPQVSTSRRLDEAEDTLLTAEQLRAARGLLRWEQKDVAKASGVSVPTIKRLEAGSGPLRAYASTVNALERALETAGVVLIPQNGGGPGVRLRKPI